MPAPAMAAAAFAKFGRLNGLRSSGRTTHVYQRPSPLLGDRCGKLGQALSSVVCSCSSGNGKSDDLDEPTEAGRAAADGAGEQDLLASDDSSPLLKGFGVRTNREPGDPSRVTDAVIQGLQDVSRAEGRTPKTRNIVMGSNSDWDVLDARVNEYPQTRAFKAIGSGGEDFVASIRAAAESVLGPLPERAISLRPSRDGNYVSVSVGPVQVSSAEQVKAVYGAMKQDERVRYFL